jgi:hypothetical protein
MTQKPAEYKDHVVGKRFNAHCCDQCARAAGLKPKVPADSGKQSCLCEVCGHYGIGSLTVCEYSNWLRIKPITQQCDSDTIYL